MPTAGTAICPRVKTTPCASADEAGYTQILLIEDSEDAMRLVEYALTTFGGDKYCLRWAKTLYEGLREASRQDVDVVLLDLGLPDSDGPISYAWIRNHAPDLPVVVLTGDDNPETKDVIKAGGASNYLLKQGLSGKLLVLAIESALQHSRGTGCAQQSGGEPRRVLLIEDDEDAMLLVGYALHQFGNGRFCLDWERSLEAGMKRLAAGGIDVVLLDLGLPDSEGTTAYMELRKLAPAVPVVVLTGNQSVELEFALLACGADEYLDKCLTSGSQLVRSVDGILYETKLRQQMEKLQSADGRRKSVAHTFWGM